jgi:hypothetical protein
VGVVVREEEDGEEKSKGDLEEQGQGGGVREVGFRGD